MLIQQVPVVFSLGVNLWWHRPGERGDFRMNGCLRTELQALQVPGNDFRRGQPVLLRVPL